MYIALKPPNKKNHVKMVPTPQKNIHVSKKSMIIEKEKT
jgi:hypothetical protein